MSSTKNQTDFLPSKLYNQIAKCLPIVSVEALIVADDGLLFLKRKNEPVKGEWWFPGGRIRKGESLDDALRREVREETGLELSHYRLINAYSRVFPERHDIAIVYLCKCNPGKVVLNDEHSEYAFFEEIPRDLHPCIRQTVADSKWEKSFR